MYIILSGLGNSLEYGAGKDLDKLQSNNNISWMENVSYKVVVPCHPLGCPHITK